MLWPISTSMESTEPELNYNVFRRRDRMRETEREGKGEREGGRKRESGRR